MHAQEEHDVTVLYDPTSASSAPSTSASASASTSDDKVQKYFDKLDSTLREKRVNCLSLLPIRVQTTGSRAVPHLIFVINCQ